MADLGPVAWPPEPIRTERLVLRPPEARDRAALIELLASREAELGYLFRPQAWGFGYAAEACAAALGWLARELPAITP